MTLTLTVLPTDRRFSESPDAGEPACLCSRCGLAISEEEIPIRAWPADGRYEYRFHPACLFPEAPGYAPAEAL